MSIKILRFSEEARRELAAGVDTLADAVTVTLGPRGRNVLLERRYDAPVSTKDGVAVAREIELGERFRNLASEIVKIVAARTSELAGDGTTTATVLARAILAEGHRLTASGHDPMALKRGIDKATTAVLGEIERIARPVRKREQIEAVALLASNRDADLAKLIADAYDEIGRRGVIAIEEGKRAETVVETTVGMEIEKGYVSPHFVTDKASGQVVLEDALILLYEERIDKAKDIAPVLEMAWKAKKSLLVVAGDVCDEALTTMAHNNVEGRLRCVAIRAPELGDRRQEILDDVAALTGGRYIGRTMALSAADATLADLGRAEHVTVGRESTVITGGKGTKAQVAARIRRIQKFLDDPYTNAYDREKLEARLAKLEGGISVIRIGGQTEIDVKERAARAEDAACAVRAAWAEGIVPGGGVAYVRASKALDALELPEDEQPAIGILRRALETPARAIARNAGHEPAVVIDRIRRGKGGFGFNAHTDRFEDLVAAGIVDPARVVRVALQSAASVAGMLLTTELVIAESPFQHRKSELSPPIPDRYK